MKREPSTVWLNAKPWERAAIRVLRVIGVLFFWWEKR